MEGLNESKYRIGEILKVQNTDTDIKNVLFKFHQDLNQLLKLESMIFFARTHKNGITYFCNQKKAFLFIDIRKKFFSARFFTGNRNIKSLDKGIWIQKGDNLGSVTYRISDNSSLQTGVLFALSAYNIAKDWGQ